MLNEDIATLEPDLMLPEEGAATLETPPLEPDAGAFTGEREQAAGWLTGITGLFKGAKSAPRTTRAVREAIAVRNAAKVAKEAPLDEATKAAVTVTPEAKQAAQNAVARAKLPEALKPVVEEGRTDWRNFNARQFDTPDDVRRLIDDVAVLNGGHMDARRGVVSWKQTEGEAEAVGLDVILGRKPSEAFNAAQLHAGVQVLGETGVRANTLAQKIAAGTSTLDDMALLEQTIALHSSIQAQLAGAVAEAGRALNIMKKVKQPAGKLQAQALATEMAGGGSERAQLLARMWLDTGGDAAKQAELARKSVGARSGEALIEVYINGLLSGPTTHLVNVTSNALFQAMQLPERQLAGLLSHIPKIGSGEMSAREALAMMQGSKEGLRDAFRLFGRTLKTGKAPEEFAGTYELADRVPAFSSLAFNMNPEGKAGHAIDLLGEYYVRLPQRALQSEDAFFKAYAYRTELHAQAMRTAAKEGLSGDALIARYAELLANPPEDMIQAGKKAADYLTFQNDLDGGWIGDMGQAMLNFRAGHPFAQLLFPFVKTPTNVALSVLERTPLAPLTQRWRDAHAVGGAAADMAKARFALGSATWGLVANEIMSEPSPGMARITGGGPADPALRKEMMARGWQPYSILLDGTYYSINRLDPLGGTLAAAADAVDLVKYADAGDDPESLATGAVMGFANAMSSKTFLQSMSDFLEVLGDPHNEKKLSGVLSKQAAGLVPAWINAIRKNTDDEVRVPSNADPLSQFVDQVKNRTWWGSQDIPARLTLWGDNVVNESPNSIMKSSKLKPDRAVDEMLANRIKVGLPRPVVPFTNEDGERMQANLMQADPTGWAYHDYQKQAGRLAREKVAEAMESDDYQESTGGPDGDKAKLIKQAFQKARREAATWLATESRWAAKIAVQAHQEAIEPVDPPIHLPDDRDEDPGMPAVKF